MKKIWVSLVTPFDKSLKVDYQAIRKYVAFLDKYDFAGFLLAGSVGEGLLLDPQEIADYIKIIREISNKQIMVGIIDFNYINAQKKMNLDADILLVTPAIYFKPSKAAVVEYLKKIAHTTNKKVMLYNNPGRVCVALDFKQYDELYSIENIVGVKECDDSIALEMISKYPKWEVFTGNDNFLVNEKIVGAVSTLANIVPSLSLNLSGNENFVKWNTLCDMAYSLPNPIAVKLVLQELGLMESHFRAQFGTLPKFEHMMNFITDCKLKN